MVNTLCSEWDLNLGRCRMAVFKDCQATIEMWGFPVVRLGSTKLPVMVYKIRERDHILCPTMLTTQPTCLDSERETKSIESLGNTKKFREQKT